MTLSQKGKDLGTCLRQSSAKLALLALLGRGPQSHLCLKLVITPTCTLVPIPCPNYGVRFYDIIDLTGAGGASLGGSSSASRTVQSSQVGCNPPTPSAHTFRTAGRTHTAPSAATPSVYSLFPAEASEEQPAAMTPQVPMLARSPRRRRLTSKTPVDLARFCQSYNNCKIAQPKSQACTGLH